MLHQRSGFLQVNVLLIYTVEEIFARLIFIVLSNNGNFQFTVCVLRGSSIYI